MIDFKSPLLIRRINTPQREVFLTFDDGPDADLTPKILDILSKHQAQASFCVIGSKARKNKALVQRILNQGHQVISHSKDHRYHHYFMGKNHLKRWILESINELNDLTGRNFSGFRPPAGVIIPPLIKASHELKIPLYMWNHRFYDTAKVFTEEKAAHSAMTMQPGDIVLLHDHKNSVNTLDFYLHELTKKNFKLKAIS